MATFPSAATRSPSAQAVAPPRHLIEVSLLSGWPLSKPWASSVFCFAEFVATVRRIADDPLRDAPSKLAALTALEQALSGAGEHAADANEAIIAASALRAASIATEVSLDHARHILQAGLWDAQGRSCRNWSELLTYCRYGAAPIGRFLLELHGENGQALAPVEALCSALRIIWLVQNAPAYWRDLGRGYLPSEWLRSAGLGPDALSAPSASPGVRQVLDRVLDGVDRLNQTAAPLPGFIADRNLRRRAAISLGLSRRLAWQLRRGDPLARPIALSSAGRLIATLEGLWRAVILGRG